MAKKKPLDAKQYEKIGKRISVSKLETGGLSKDASAHIEVIKDDMYANVLRELDKEGSTGKLSNSDGVLKGTPQIYKGFFVQVFGMKKYQNNLDVYGKWIWFGFAKFKTILKGKEATVNFSTEHAYPLGLDSEREAGQFLFKAVDAYRSGGIN